MSLKRFGFACFLYCVGVVSISCHGESKSLSDKVHEKAGEQALNQSSPKKVERIIALSPHSVEMLFAIGAGDKIVGTVEYADYPKAAQNILRIGSYAGVQIEQVVKLKPDLIIAWKGGNKLSDLRKLASLGFNIFYTHPKQIDGIFIDMKLLGEKIGHQQQAAQVINKIKKQYQQITEKYAEKRPVKVFYQLWHDPLRTVGPGSWVESLLEDCHGQNVFSDAENEYPVIDFESILARDPEVIIVPHHSGNVGAKKQIWQNWKNIQAIKNDHFTVIDGDLLHRFGPRAVEGLAQLCHAIDQAR
ncbi:cobalamin-binding protein [Aliikangiella maris]|uniref:Cobalamin-binding protein n=2 Tax=Aliikangiella maris TaxID=3162458 RepID=A0ABV2BWB3_9GAMM